MMSRSSAVNFWGLVAVVAGVALLDFWLPLGVASGVAYIGVIWIALHRERASEVLITAVICTALTIAGYFYSRGPGETLVDVVLFNRGLAILAIWLTAVIGLMRRQSEVALQQRTDSLKAEVAERSEQVRRESAQRQQVTEERDRFFTLSLDILCTADLDGYFRSVNPAFERALGYSEEELLSRPFFEMVHPDDREKTLAEVRKLSQGQDTRHFENRYLRKDGTYCWIQWSTPAVKEGQELLFAVGRDITQQKEQEEKLAHLSILVEATEDGVIGTDPDGLIQAWNSGAEELFGLAANDVLGRDFSLMVEQSYREIVRQAATRLARGERVESFDAACNQPSGKHVEVSLKMSAIRDVEGRLLGTSIIARDITDRKRALQTLQDAKEAAEAANRAKNDFLANMSHEVRTPMNAVIGMTELLLDTTTTETQHEYLTMVLESSEALLTIINELLDFSKIEAGRLELESYPFALRELVGDTVKSLALRAHRKGLELLFEIESDVPDDLVGDSGRFRQLIINLVGNAIKFTEAGEVVFRVELSAEQPGGTAIRLHCTVHDTGIGIAPEKQQSIFDAFSQADSSTTRRFGGTGLGLAISLRLVELMEGDLWVESELGEGSAFHFTSLFEVSEPQWHQGPAASDSLAELPVLVVDDNATNRKILKATLQNWGMNPIVVANAQDALAMLWQHVSNERFPLVIVDVHMPEMDGYTFCERVRETPELADTVLVILTSGDRPVDPALASRLQIAARLMKPVKQSELRQTIARVLGRNLLDANGNRHMLSWKADSKLPPLQILLVEDGVTNQRLAKGLLERWGHRVMIARNGREAVAAHQVETFDLILMDIQMPEMDGFEATRLIRQAESSSDEHVPIIAMTARAMKGDRQRCLEAGMDAYISKPVRQKELYEAMEPFAPGEQTTG